MSNTDSSSSIMSVAEMIDNAFGEPDVNTVNHKLIQTILYILARQLRILERRVEIEIGVAEVQHSSSSLSVTEVKIHAMQKKKKKVGKAAGSRSGGTLEGDAGKPGGGRVGGGRMGGGGMGVGTGGGGTGGGRKGGEGTGGRAKGGEGTGGGGAGGKRMDVGGGGSGQATDRAGLQGGRGGTSGKPGSGSSEKTSSDKTYSEKTPTDKSSSQKTTYDKTKSSSDKSGKTSSDKTSSVITSSDKTSTDKTSSDKTSSVKTLSDKTTSDKTTSDKTSSDKTTSGKTSSDKTTTQLTSTEITTTDLTSSGKTNSGKTSSEMKSSDKTSSDKTTSDQTQSTKTSTYKSLSEPTSSDKTSSKDKTSPSDKQYTSSSSKSTTDKSSSDKPSTDKSSSGKTTTETTSSSKQDPEYWASLLETIEQQRETELRVIRQRSDSRQASDKTPSPMASLDSVEATYEKLLIIERVPAEKAKAALAAKAKSGNQVKAPRISVVTQEQFERLAIVVRQLQEKFGPVGSASFPENIQLMQELRKGASLTDAMAALQLSARLEASEKAMEQMMALVTELASKTPGIDLTAGTEEDMQVLFGTGGQEDGAAASAKSSDFQKSQMKSKKEAKESSSEESVNIPLPLPQSVVDHRKALPSAGTKEEVEKLPPDRITYEELDNAMQELYDNIMKTVNALTTKSTVNADNAFKIASKLEGKLDASLNLGTRMHDLEDLVSDYSDQINILDTSLSSQMTNYQEELTQMQHDLETALETMAEVLANAGGDTTAVAELNSHFTSLQSDIDDTMMRQKELRNNQNTVAFDLDSLRKQIEILRDTKADREEVADALRDKAGLGALNGLVSLQQFDAVRGDIEKRIGAAYEKFNSQETIWQKAIDDLFRDLNEKADCIQVESLKDDINKHLEILRCRLNAMMEVVGEPKAAAVAKKLFRDATCLSCSTPADMELEEHGIPALPSIKLPAIGAEAEKPKEDGDHRPCYPGHPIPHPRDPRALVCQRWCGGSHTMINNAVSKVPPSMIITPAMREISTALGTDGKLYMVDEPLKPCRPCSTRMTTPQPSIAEPAQVIEEVDVGSDMTPSDFQNSFAAMPAQENETPPPPLDTD